MFPVLKSQLIHKKHLSGSYPAQPLTYFCCAIDILNGKHLSQSIEENFGKSWHQLGRGDQDVHTVFSEREKTTKKALLKAYQQPVVLKATLGSSLSSPKAPSVLLPSLSKAQILFFFV